jgi:hypothetical protein
VWRIGVLAFVCGCRFGFDATGDARSGDPMNDTGSPDPDSGSGDPDTGGSGSATLVRAGLVSYTTAMTVAPSLPAPSTAGTFLVATMASDGDLASSAPPPWQLASGTVHSGGGVCAIFIYPSNPGGITTVTITSGASANVYGQLSEWAMPTTPDRSGNATLNATGQVTVTATAPNALPGGLAITSYELSVNPAQAVTLTPSTGWTRLGSSETALRNEHYVVDYRVDSAMGQVISETITSSKAGDWTACLATFD